MFYFTESAGTILMLSIVTRLVGLLFSPPFPITTGVSRDFFQDVVAFDQFAEGGVLMIERMVSAPGR